MKKSESEPVIRNLATDWLATLPKERKKDTSIRASELLGIQGLAQCEGLFALFEFLGPLRVQTMTPKCGSTTNSARTGAGETTVGKRTASGRVSPLSQWGLNPL